MHDITLQMLASQVPATRVYPIRYVSSGRRSHFCEDEVDGESCFKGGDLIAPDNTRATDTTFLKLFVGGLPYHTTDKSLRDHFKIYGEIEEAVVITDRQTGKSRGYGFVIMSDRASAERACKEPNPIIDGRKANVNLAFLGQKPRGNASAAAFPFQAIRTGYPTSFLAQQQYGLPATSYVYQPAQYGGQPLLTTTASPALAQAIASAQAQSPMSQFYEFQQHLSPATLASAGGNAATHAFAAQAAFADPFASSYLATGGGHHGHAYAAYLPQMAAAGAGSQSAGGIPGMGMQAGMNPYAAAVSQDSRLQ